MQEIEFLPLHEHRCFGATDPSKPFNVLATGEMGIRTLLSPCPSCARYRFSEHTEQGQSWFVRHPDPVNGTCKKFYSLKPAQAELFS